MPLAQGSVRATIITALSGSWIPGGVQTQAAAAGLHRMRGREPRSQVFVNGLSPACLAPVEAGDDGPCVSGPCKAPVGAGLEEAQHTARASRPPWERALSTNLQETCSHLSLYRVKVAFQKWLLAIHRFSR